jgi:hypothetical protein
MCGGSVDVAAVGCREAQEPSGLGANERQHNTRVRRAKQCVRCEVDIQRCTDTWAGWEAHHAGA